MQSVFSTKRSFARIISNAARLVQLAPLTGQRILAYHSIGNSVDGDVNNIYSLSRSQFVEQIESVQRFADEHGFSFVPFGTPIDKTISITFDDGYSDVLSVAAPMLYKLKIPFHIAIIKNCK